VTRVGIVGAGFIAEVHARAWRSLGVELAGYSRSGIGTLADCGMVEYDSLVALIDAVDLVDVCTPTPFHPEIVGAALDRRRAVLCEKPLALTVAEATALADRADRAGTPLYVGHVLRYFGPYAAAKRALDAQALGRPAVARFVRMGEFPSWGRWLGDDRQSGGIILDQMIHDLDMARWLFGPVTVVQAEESVRVADSPVRSAHVLLRHHSGAISSITGVWGTVGLAFATRFSVSGATGRLDHDSRTHLSYSADPGRSGPRESMLPLTSDDPWKAQLADVLDALNGGPPPRSSAADAVEAVRIAQAAVTGARTGETVELESHERQP